MIAEFELRTPPGQDESGNPLPPVEYVRITLGPAQVPHRAATPEDRHRFKAEYQAFKAATAPADSIKARLGFGPKLRGKG